MSVPCVTTRVPLLIDHMGSFYTSSITLIPNSFLLRYVITIPNWRMWVLIVDSESREVRNDWPGRYS